MDYFNLRELATAAWKDMQANGASKKILKESWHTGFGSALRHFGALGIETVNAAMLDDFVQAQRLNYENGAFSMWKWRYIRRCCEILKFYSATGSSKIGMRRPWYPPIQKPKKSIIFDTPAPAQFAIPDEIFVLVWKTERAMLQAGLSAKTVRSYVYEGLGIILRKHYDSGLEQYMEPLINNLVLDKRKAYEQGQISRAAYQNVRKAAALLMQMQKCGEISLSPLPSWGLREPCEEFQKMLQHFCCNAQHTGILADGTIKTARSAIRSFLFQLEDDGYTNFSSMSLTEISSAVTAVAMRYAGGLHSGIWSVRVFLRHLYQFHFTPVDYSHAIPAHVPIRKNHREGFHKDELLTLLSAPDTNLALGKRDFAIMLLAAQTGLRACDIVNLKRDNIDWRMGEIRLTQQKTGKPIVVPLTAECGNAIADYLLHARPSSNLPYVFLCHSGVKRPINARSASAMVTRYMRRCELDHVAPWRGFHSFRRTLGTKLVQEETPLDVVQQILGHTHMDSMQPYLSIDELGLRECAIGLISERKVGK